MIRLVISDMDGTITGPDEKIPDGVAALIAGLKARGIIFTVATGRSDGYMAGKLPALGLHSPYIAANGGTIVDGSTVLQRKQFAVLPLRDVVSRCYDLGLSVVFTFDGVERIEYASAWTEAQDAKSGTDCEVCPLSEEEWTHGRIDKLVIFDPEKPWALDEIEAMLGAIPGDFTFARYRWGGIELNEKTVNKADGVCTLARMLGILPEEVLVIGDDDNDVGMFSLPGIGAVVANGSDRAKRAADYVCSNERFEGVAEAVCRFTHFSCPEAPFDDN